MTIKLGLIFFLGLAIAAPACASPIAFQVNTMSIETSMDAGQSQTGVITVCNIAKADNPAAAADDSVRLRIYAMDWTLDRAGKPKFDTAGALPDSCSNWITISPLEMEIPAGQSQQVRYTINVPSGVQGTFRAMIMFQTVPRPASGQRVMFVSGRIGTAVYVTVGAQAKRLRIDSFGASPTDTLLTIENTGNTYVRIKGNIQYQDASNHTIAEASLPGSVVLSGQNNQRDFDITNPKLPSGTYTVTVVIDYGGAVLIGARTHVTVP